MTDHHSTQSWADGGRAERVVQRMHIHTNERVDGVHITHELCVAFDQAIVVSATAA